ncbi:MAG: DUF3971 domain-containing protein [Cognatishimia sp.]|nr:DUF3971 domain-containing protein [Cognatishimia sp.]
MPEQMTQPDPVKPKSRLRRVGLWVLGTLLVFCLAVAVLGVTSIGRTIQLAPWMNAQLVTQLSNAVPGGSVRFEGATVLIEDDYHPHVVFERLDLVPDDGGPVMSISEVAASLSYRKLLQGQIAPREIRMSGVVLNASRAGEGEVALAIDGGEGVAETSTSLGDIEQEIDRLLQTSEFENLQRVSLDAITIQFDDQRAGRSWTVDGGSFLLTREGKALRMTTSIALLGGRDYVSTLEFNFETELGQSTAQFGVNFEDVPSTDIASQSAALTWLNILDAPISGAMRFEIDESGDLGPLNAALRISEGVVQPGGQVRPVPFRSAGTHFTYDPQSDAIEFTELVADSAWGQARAEGVAYLRNMQGGLPGALWGQFQFTELSGNPAGLFGAPVSIDHAQADFRLDLTNFTIDVGEFLLRSDGQTAVAKGQFLPLEEGWKVRLNAQMAEVDAREVVRWWPENAQRKPRKWVDENILAGQLRDVNFALRAEPGSKPDIYLDFEFDKAEVRYVKTLPPVTKAKGRAVWVDNRFVVTAEGGEVSPGRGGVLDATGTSFVIPNTRIKQGPAEVHLKTRGTVSAALSLLDHKPLEVFSKAGLPVDLADGEVEVKGRIDLFLRKGLKPEDVQFDIAATAENVRSTQLVPGKQIAAPRLSIIANSQTVSVSGQGRVGSVPIEATWSTILGQKNGGKSQLSGSVELSERTVDEFNLGLSQELLSGKGEAAIRVDFERGTLPQLTVTSDLRGLDMAIPALGWRKPASRAAELSLKVALDQPASVTELRLSASGLEALGDITLREDGGMGVFTLERLTVGSWFDGSAKLTGRPGQPMPGIELTSGTLDLRKIPETSNTTGAKTPFLANLTRVRVSNTIDLTSFGGSFLAGGGMQGEFRARVNGGAAISGSLTPVGGRSAIRILSADAGNVLRSAEFLRNASGGTLQLDLNPLGDSEFDGRAIIKGVRIQDAPAFAELLNAVSVVGLLDQMAGEGILFTDVESRFRIGPNRIAIAQGSAVGPSMGVSADGIYHTDTRSFEMQGVVSPIYVLNALGRPIARKGEGLFGLNYTLRGPVEDLRISVNPLSVLTPGIFRNIFRRPPPSLDEASE